MDIMNKKEFLIWNIFLMFVMGILWYDGWLGCYKLVGSKYYLYIYYLYWWICEIGDLYFLYL